MTSTRSTVGNRLQDKVCVVTGASSGIGRAISLAYAGEGAKVVCADLTSQARAHIAAEQEVSTHKEIQNHNGQAIFVKTDVSLPEDMQNLIREAVRTYGRVDVLVNNAGISTEAGSSPLRIHETPVENLDKTLAVNVKSVFLGCKYATEQMLKQEPFPGSLDRGWIINMSSIYGLVGGRFNSCYAASKAAVSNLTRQVALDYGADRIHCNAICPGYTRTAIYKDTMKHLHDEEVINALHPLGGAGSPEDIVGAAIFLASSEAGWITGVSLPVDGGYTAM